MQPLSIDPTLGAVLLLLVFILGIYQGAKIARISFHK